MPRKTIAVVLLLIAALIAYFLLRGDDEVNAEAKYDGVHLCSPSQRAAAEAAATRAPSPRPTATRVPTADGAADEPPLFAQNDPVWGNQEYDHGAKQDVGCGRTIAECGCAMTSVATVLRLFNVVNTPEGAGLNPSSLNGWFNQNAQLTTSGWVSQGYQYGNVVWTAVNNLTAALPAENAKPLRYKGWGNGSEAEVRSELEAGRPVILEVPGHFIAAVGLQGDQILINDPFYRDRTTLASYRGRVKSSRLFQPSEDRRALLISVPANMRVRVTDPQGRVVGTLTGGSPAEAEKSAQSQIPGATYRFEEAWRDPTCTERPPPDGAGVNTIFIPNPEKGIYKVEVVNPGGDDSASVVYAYDINGRLKMETRSGGRNVTYQIDYDPGAPSAPTTPTPTPTSTAGATATGTPTSAGQAVATSTPPPARATATPVPPTEPPPPADTETPTAEPSSTRTPAPAMTISTITAVLSESQVGTGAPGCHTTLSWTVSGDLAGIVELRRNGATIHGTTIGPKSFQDQFQPGTWTYQIRATNSQGVQFLSQTVTVTPICVTLFSVTPGCNNTVNWQIMGTATGTVRVQRRVYTSSGTPVPSPWTTFHTETLSPAPRSVVDPAFNDDEDYRLEILVGSRIVHTNIIYVRRCD
ncbi:MAG TPA: C39 family peptidase [Dehalococcoidia bacterium]|nr:C39 family peptidase [Dehalococcoidia bacterium]